MDSEQLVPEPPSGQTGMGGGLLYLQETPTLRMVNQEHNFSCVVACARQLLREAGDEFTEVDLVERIGVDEEFGSTLEPAAHVLSELHPRLIYAAGSIEPEYIHSLTQRDSWIARVKTTSSRYHAVIVDGLRGDVLSVRDPWGLNGPGSGSGTEATILLRVFLEHWRFGIHGTIFPRQLKVVT